MSPLAELVCQKIENLRPKLLDLSRRNPLIATKLSPRSNSHIRAVDELPDVLFYKLNNGQELRLISLPAIEDDPRDEQTREFRDFLINARLTDTQHLSEMEAVDRDSEDYGDRTRQIERALKDRVREALGLPPRITRSELNLAQHARINGITPSYDLPTPNAEHEDGRHTDDNIQTLLLPDDLERKLNAISSKCRTWIQETGINVLQVAYGFLEWSDGVQSETSFAPLILFEAQLNKRRTTQGVAFSIIGTGDEPTTNAVLAEKLRLDFGVELPEFTGASVEQYLGEVARLSLQSITWRVRRQVAIGVFPSARMAMYHDLDTKQEGFPESQIVQDLLGGTDSGASSPFADEYEVDQPDIERKVPCLVMDADSSQFSALVDIAEGKNLAVEGPPGTGKSQTIINAIAAALAEGKKVLFVAEKLAALNVVKSRLESIGLGEFLLPLQAEKSTREQVIASIRERMEMRPATAIHDYDAKLAEYRRLRQEIATYIGLMARPFQNTGLTIHEIHGKYIATNPCLTDFAQDVLGRCKVPDSLLTASGLTLLRQLGDRIAQAHKEASSATVNWRTTKLLHPDRFTIEEACDLAARAGQAFVDLDAARAKLADIRLPPQTPSTALSELQTQLEAAESHLRTHGVTLLLNLLQGNNAAIAQNFIDRCKTLLDQREKLSRILTKEPGTECLEMIRRTADICQRRGLFTIDTRKLAEDVQKKKRFLDTARGLTAALKPLVERRSESRSWPLSDLAKAHAAIKEAGRDALIRRSVRAQGLDTIYLLKDLCREGKKLQDQKAALSAKVSLDIDASVDALSECVSTLRAAGPMRIFSSKYRRAKIVFRSLDRAGKYERHEAVDTLEQLISFRRREEQFNSNPHVLALFSHHFRGADTEFEQFERLGGFYEQVDAHFERSDKTTLGAFLREADLHELDLLLATPKVDSALTYEALQNRMRAAETSMKISTQAISELDGCIHVFRDPSSVKAGILPKLLDTTRAMAEEGTKLDQNADARIILGTAFKRSRTTSEDLRNVVQWTCDVHRSSQALGIILRANMSGEARRLIQAVLRAEAQADDMLARVSGTAKIDSQHFKKSSLQETARRLKEAATDSDGLYRHATFATALEDVRPTGLLPLISERLSNTEGLTGLGEQFEAIAVRQLAKAVYADLGPSLTRYPGSKMDKLRSLLAMQDREIIRLARKQLRTKVCASAQPPRGNGIGRKSTWTELALIENETSKQKRFIPVRDLTRRAGRALLELKPCWMMSPLSVAQYIPKNSLTFDLCIIDEASQMPPESAIGSLLRCKQTVVVGDTNQLPPTKFFRTLIDDEEADEDETVLNESILEMANATFRPARRLRWHYRSRHSGLIRFSNHVVYDNDLIVFPSATETIQRMGVSFQSVQGRYKAGTNPIEAKAMVEAVLEFMRDDPDRSLGVVTLNQKQRDLISEEFEYAVGDNEDAAKYLEHWKDRDDGLQEFFIKNLENVQGDERDVIFIGTVYGPEEPGARVMQRFGPINGVAGKRRLNVLFTRAKQKIVTFSSMTAADIVVEENGNVGAYMLKRWLEYSASGVLESGNPTPRPPESDFEIFVAQQIQSLGCDAHPQVGVAGYFIDIGIRHPDWPHGYILGVECDGAAYHSAKSARDRDRLRQEVLEGLGWRLHRIWSTDWFNNPQREAEKLRAIIDSRLTELKQQEFEYFAKASAPTPAAEITTHRQTDDPQMIVEDGPLPETNGNFGQGIRVPSCNGAVAVGDTVRVRYTDDQTTLQVTISREISDPSQGIVSRKSPIAVALLDAEVGDEVKVLAGSYVRPAVVEKIIKNGMNAI